MYTNMFMFNYEQVCEHAFTHVQKTYTFVQAQKSNINMNMNMNMYEVNSKSNAPS